MATNRRIVENVQEDFYPTPAWATEALLAIEKIPIGRTILEPCCGDGAISKVLEHAGYSTHSFDITHRGFGNINGPVDIYSYNVSHGTVITNPPYNDMKRMFSKLYSLADIQLCLLLRIAFLEGIGRYENIFSKTPPSRVWVFSERLSMYKNGNKGEKASGTTCYAWFVWDKKAVWKFDHSPALKWIPPGFRHD